MPTIVLKNIHACWTGASLDRAANTSGSGCVGAARHSAHRHLLFSRRVFRQRCRDDAQRISSLQRGLFGMILVKVLAPGFYARQNIQTPVKIALITLVATQLMNLAFIIPLRHAGLALAIGLGACLNARTALL